MEISFLIICSNIEVATAYMLVNIQKERPKQQVLSYIFKIFSIEKEQFIVIVYKSPPPPHLAYPNLVTTVTPKVLDFL